MLKIFSFSKSLILIHRRELGKFSLKSINGAVELWQISRLLYAWETKNVLKIPNKRSVDEPSFGKVLIRGF